MTADATEAPREAPAAEPRLSRAEALKQRLGLTVGPTPVKHRRGHAYGIILLHNGDLDHVAITEKPWVAAKSGAYVPESGALFRVQQTIKAGSLLAVWVEGDPEPVSTRQPVGYGAKMLRLLVGPLLPRIIDAGLDANPLTWDRRRILLAFAVIGAAAVAAWLWAHRKKHGG